MDTHTHVEIKTAEQHDPVGQGREPKKENIHEHRVGDKILAVQRVTHTNRMCDELTS